MPFVSAGFRSRVVLASMERKKVAVVTFCFGLLNDF